jgi:hypothetical protein
LQVSKEQTARLIVIE